MDSLLRKMNTLQVVEECPLKERMFTSYGLQQSPGSRDDENEIHKGNKVALSVGVD